MLVVFEVSTSVWRNQVRVCAEKGVGSRCQPQREGITDRSPGKPWLALSPLSPGACVALIYLLTCPLVKGPFPTCRLTPFGEQVKTQVAAAIAAKRPIGLRAGGCNDTRRGKSNLACVASSLDTKKLLDKPQVGSKGGRAW